PVEVVSPSRIALAREFSLKSMSSSELPNRARTNESAVPVLLPPVFEISATVDPVTFAFLPMIVVVLSSSLTSALALLKSPAPPLSVCALIDDVMNVVAISFTLPPATMVIPLPSTWAVPGAVSPVMPSLPKSAPMNEVLLWAPGTPLLSPSPTIDASTSGIATRPPEPFSLLACVLVATFDVTQKSPPTVTVLAATYDLTVGLTTTRDVGTATAIAAPPPPPADALVSPLPLGGELPRIELPSGSSSFCDVVEGSDPVSFR